MWPLLICAVLQGHVAVDAPHKGRIGILLNTFNNKVSEVYPDSNAEKAGLQEGDKIIYHSDKDILGNSGTLCVIEIKRKTGKNTYIRKVLVVTRQPVESVNTHRKKIKKP